MEALKQEPSYLWLDKENHQDLIDSSLRANTKRAYASDLKGYAAFTGTTTIEKDLVLLYLKHLASKGRKWSTISRVAYSLKVPGIDTHLKGLKNIVFDKDASKVTPKKARPLTRSKLIEVLESDISDRDKLLINLGWVGAMRLSEILNIKKNDLIRVDGYYLLKIYNSKNVNRGEIQYKKLQYPNNDTICPVERLDKWIDKLSGDDYLFQGYHGKQLSSRGAMKAIKKVLGNTYQSHSMRRGVITYGFEQGCTISQLMHLSGHKKVESLMEYDGSDFIKNNAVNFLA